MSDEIYNRLKSLVTGVGISVDDNSSNDAELYCYAQALGAVREQMRAIKDELFAVSENGIKRYVKLLNINIQDKTRDQIVDEIHAKLSDDYGNLKAEQMAEDFLLVGSGTYTLKRGRMTFSDVAFEDLGKLSEFIRKWTVMNTLCIFAGNGMKFDQWDAMENSFDYYDRLQLPFDILDTYYYNDEESEAIE